MTTTSDRTLTEDGVTAATAGVLRTAMHRLLTGTARRTDGRLTKQNLWKEAGVSRATMNRAHTILAEWDAHVAQHSATSPEQARRDDEIQELRHRLVTKTRECTDLQRRLDAAATAIAALHHDNTLLRQALGQDHVNVIPLRHRIPEVT
ncbi:hypothetical protein [Amycolatopsis thailandensis]|uniref:hypothetical protein n=1 Tax=Amycolatopsis thailandensis TaxID=589330 RepID=UPI0036303634